IQEHNYLARQGTPAHAGNVGASALHLNRTVPFIVSYSRIDQPVIKKNHPFFSLQSFHIANCQE
ncbi:MAG TPA: hypothetical protein PKW17_11150, partial [Smithellaceae bacterium]|nr:hypothetical protein [Smithellaceae bacterium]